MTSDPIRHDDPMQSPLWRYALALYAKSGVASACLALQAHAGVDVCVLLHALYAANRGRPLTPAQLEASDQRVRGWRERVILPLRHLRQDMKDGIAPVPQALLELIRQEVKQAELQAEQVTLAMLHLEFQAQAVSPAAGPRSGSTVREVVRLYLRLSQLPAQRLQLPQVQQAIENLERQAGAMPQEQPRGPA